MPTDRPPAVALHLDAEALKPLVRIIVAEVIDQLRDAEARTADRLAYSEAEAARLLGLNTHQLRDMRLRGDIEALKIVGGRVRYSREQLLAYLARRRVG